MRYTVSTEDTDELRPGETDETASILQGLRVLLATRRGSVPFYREFGLTMEFLDLSLIHI